MTKIFLILFIFVQGSWKPVFDVDGFYPRPYSSMEICMKRAAEANDNTRSSNLMWACASMSMNYHEENE